MRPVPLLIAVTLAVNTVVGGVIVWKLFQPAAPAATPEEVAALRAEIESDSRHRGEDYSQLLGRLRKMEKQQSEDREFSAQNQDFTTRHLKRIQPILDDLQEQSMRNAIPRHIPTSLPPSFVETVTFNPEYCSRDPVSFRMILVPGDPSRGLPHYYIGETEVTWDLFKPFSCREDVPLQEAEADYRMHLRPSDIMSFHSPDGANGMAFGQRPACSMSRLNAEKFCLWLSKRTGRHYRIPTESEWDQAYRLGGDDLGHPVNEACHRENSFESEFVFNYFSRPVRQGKPDALGLYDMLGNVAEWVKTPPDGPEDNPETYVRGGHFSTPPGELKGSWRAKSDQAIWNMTYPDNPKSQWWYMNAGFVGLRLVCEPYNLPAN